MLILVINPTLILPNFTSKIIKTAAKLLFIHRIVSFIKHSQVASFDCHEAWKQCF